MERKVCFVLDASNRWGVEGGRAPVQRPTPPPRPPTTRGQELLSTEGGGYMQKQHRQLWQASWNWSCGGLTSVILIVLGTVSLQFWGQFVSISLKQILGIVAAYVMPTVWSSCSSLLPPDGGFSICKTAHRIWLRILSIALGEEIKILGFAYWPN